jgi:hypothetical protein
VARIVESGGLRLLLLRKIVRVRACARVCVQVCARERTRACAFECARPHVFVCVIPTLHSTRILTMFTICLDNVYMFVDDVFI